MIDKGSPPPPIIDVPQRLIWGRSPGHRHRRARRRAGGWLDRDGRLSAVKWRRVLNLARTLKVSTPMALENVAPDLARVIWRARRTVGMTQMATTAHLMGLLNKAVRDAERLRLTLDAIRDVRREPAPIDDEPVDWLTESEAEIAAHAAAFCATIDGRTHGVADWKVAAIGKDARASADRLVELVEAGTMSDAVKGPAKIKIHGERARFVRELTRIFAEATGRKADGRKAVANAPGTGTHRPGYRDPLTKFVDAAYKVAGLSKAPKADGITTVLKSTRES